jgi:PhoH-like ATPase
MKNYILDTTVLLYDPNALFAFAENNVIIPITVIEEIDNFKKDMSEVGRNARQTSRILDKLRMKGTLSSGVKLDNGGVLSVRISSKKSIGSIPLDFQEKKRDTFLFAVAMEEHEKTRLPTILVTKDVYLRIKADALSIVVSDYESDRVEIEELYTGYDTVYTDTASVDFLKSGKPVPCDTIEKELLPNEYVTLVDEKNNNNVVYGRYYDGKKQLCPLIQQVRQIFCRVSSRNREQAFALDALLNDEIGFVTLVGKAGTGKTLLAVAASVYKTVDENSYNRILVSRPTLPMGQDIGYLPGTVEEKLTPWMYPIADNIELIMRSEKGVTHKIRGFRELIDMGILVIEPLTFIRGRSIHNQYLIVDEAQNLTPHEIKTIITRVGDGTKIVLTGDPYQIDNPYIDSSSNGLTYVVEKFKKQSITAHVTLTKGERSVISELAANLL